MPMDQNLLTIFSQFGLPGLVILGLALYVVFLNKAQAVERKQFLDAISLFQDRLDKQNTLLFETIRANTEKLSEFKISLEKFIAQK